MLSFAENHDIQIIGNMKLAYSETSTHCSHMYCFHAIIIHFFQSQKITPVINVNVTF